MAFPVADIALLLPFRPVSVNGNLTQNEDSLNGLPVCALGDAQTNPSRRCVTGSVGRGLRGDDSQHQSDSSATPAPLDHGRYFTCYREYSCGRHLSFYGLRVGHYQSGRHLVGQRHLWRLGHSRDNHHYGKLHLASSPSQSQHDHSTRRQRSGLRRYWTE
jgi:hypothetical protein